MAQYYGDQYASTVPSELIQYWSIAVELITISNGKPIIDPFENLT